MLNEGYVKIHRKIINWEWYTDIPVRIVFEHLLFTANWIDKKWHGIDIRRGEKITSYSNLANETGLSTQQVRTALKKLKNTRRNNNQSNKQIYHYKH